MFDVDHWQQKTGGNKYLRVCEATHMCGDIS